MRALGLMSGTSLDGIDAAVIETDGETISEFGPWLTAGYDDELRERLRTSLGQAAPAGIDALIHDLTIAHGDAVRQLLSQGNLSNDDIDIIGFHGHTIDHRPDNGVTRQIGDGALLAESTGIDVVCDFRSADVAAGGQGAPLAPLYHGALAAGLPKPLAVVNIGGVANVTWIGADDEMLAFDTGPGNALIDDWARRCGLGDMDMGGGLARAGRIDETGLADLLANDYFHRTPPKSLDRNDFALLASLAGAPGWSAADGAATLTAFTARSVAKAQTYFPDIPKQWLVCGGGRHNPALMAALRSALEAEVVPVESVGWRGDYLEAEAFAYLALRHLDGLPLSLPTTTGVPHPMPGGRLNRNVV